MVRKSLIVAALMAVSSPLAAQDEGWVWTPDRPDATTPMAVFGARTLDMGAIEVQYQYIQRNYMGVWSGGDSLGVASTIAAYQVAPLTLSDVRHSAQVSFGLLDDVTLRARGEFAFFERSQQRNDGTYYITTAHALGDIQADVTYNVIRSGNYRVDVNGGVLIPIGKAATYAETPFSTPNKEATPYDMRPGSGSFGVTGAVAADVQNEVGSIGAQFKMRSYIDENARGFTLGDRYEGNVWVAYVLNEHLSLSAGARWEKWGNIDGADRDLALTSMRDPMHDPVFLGGIRTSMPLGVNWIMPAGSPLAGHRVQLESIYTLHHDYDGPQIGMDWGLNLGYTVAFE